jgi:hypothetical protein
MDVLSFLPLRTTFLLVIVKTETISKVRTCNLYLAEVQCSLHPVTCNQPPSTAMLRERCAALFSLRRAIGPSMS